MTTHDETDDRTDRRPSSARDVAGRDHLTDGGVAGRDARADAERAERPADCACDTLLAGRAASVPCFPCFREGFETPNPDDAE
jgi:hypothetical protein